MTRGYADIEAQRRYGAQRAEPGRDARIAALYTVGASHELIAIKYGISRQRVRQIVLAQAKKATK